MLQLLITLAAGLISFTLARRFVRGRLRFVDAVHSPVAPIIAGLAAALLASPTAILPFVTGATVAAFGIGTGLGTASGSRAIRQTTAEYRKLTR